MARQWLVDAIVWAWPVMPRRLRLWAFMNDGGKGSWKKHS